MGLGVTRGHHPQPWRPQSGQNTPQAGGIGAQRPSRVGIFLTLPPDIPATKTPGDPGAPAIHRSVSDTAAYRETTGSVATKPVEIGRRTHPQRREGNRVFFGTKSRFSHRRRFFRFLGDLHSVPVGVPDDLAWVQLRYGLGERARAVLVDVFLTFQHKSLATRSHATGSKTSLELKL